jgi:hypothetical protein
MQKIDDIKSTHILDSLLSSSVSSTIEKDDDIYADIQSFQSKFKSLTRSPDVVRLMLQAEFNFHTMINVPLIDMKQQDELLQMDWSDSTFLIVDYSNVEKWIEKAVHEAERGRTIVCLVPARTSTAWFHDLCLNRANQIRFVKGKITMPPMNKPSSFPDAIIIYSTIPIKRRKVHDSKVALLQCATSLTSTDTEFKAT